MTLLPSTRAQVMEAATRQAARGARRRLGGRGWWSPRRLPALRLGWIVPAASVAVAVAVAALVLSTHAAPRPATAPGGGGTRLVFRLEAMTRSEPVTPTLVRREAAVLRARLALELPVPARVTRLGRDRLAVISQSATVPELDAAIAPAHHLRLYDWEANVLLPDGRTVASELAHGAPSNALLISQGVAASAPGSPSAGGVDLYAAVRLAASRPPATDAGDKPVGDQYYLFGGKGGVSRSACGAGPASRCLLAGPILVPVSTPRAQAVAELDAQVPAVQRGGAQVLVVRPGAVVLEAVASRSSGGPLFGAPSARYFVLRDRVGVPWSGIADTHASTDSSGAPDVAFGFSASGGRAFERMTAAVSQRGTLLGTSPQSRLDQHFAIALGDELISVPYIDYSLYPDGISSRDGAELSGAFTAASARRLAASVAAPQLPVPLVPAGG